MILHDFMNGRQSPSGSISGDTSEELALMPIEGLNAPALSRFADFPLPFFLFDDEDDEDEDELGEEEDFDDVEEDDFGDDDDFDDDDFDDDDDDYDYDEDVDYDDFDE
jgi:hypothetical protein